MVPDIDYGQLQQRLQDPRTVLVNALPAEAWRQARIPGSLSLPLAEVQTRAATVLPDKDRPVVVYCGGPT